MYLGGHSRATALSEALTADRARLLGPDHPDAKPTRWLSEAAQAAVTNPEVAERLAAMQEAAEHA